MSGISWELFDSLRAFIGECGGLCEASVKLNVSTSTLQKMLSGNPMSAATVKKVADYVEKRTLGGDPVQSRISLSVSKIPLRDKLRNLINNEMDVLKVASILKVGPTTIHKILNGVRITRSIEKKIKVTLENINSINDLGTGNPPLISRLQGIYKMYQEEGTLEAVANKIGLTRERVRQLLVKGTKIGIFEYKPFNKPYIPKEKLIDDYTEMLSLQKVAKANQISVNYLKELMTAHSITESDLKSHHKVGRRQKCINLYYRIKENIGHNPTTTELQNTREGHALHAQINRLWGSIDSFRESLNIPKPPQGSPSFKEDVKPWIEHKQRIAFITRMQHLDRIRECLRSSPKGRMQIDSECNLHPNRTLNLLALLRSAGEVQQVGATHTTKYRLITE